MIDRPASPPPAPGKSSRLAELRHAYTHSLPEKRAQIEALWDGLIHREWRRESLEELFLRVHGMSGSGLMYGHPAISTVARRLEQEIKELRATGGAPEASRREVLSQLVRELAHTLQEAAQVAPSTAAQDPPSAPLAPPMRNAAGETRRPLIFLADDDRELAALLALYLGQQGYEVRCFEHPAILANAAAAERPDLAISDIVFPEGESAGTEVLARFKARVPVPLIFISARVDLAARVQAMRAGGDAYLMKPIDLGALAAKLRELIEGVADDPYRILLVDDEPEVSRLNASVLEQAGMRCETLNDPAGIMRPLMEFQPELIITDLHMPGIDGFELARIIRQEEAFINTPIFFLSSDTQDSNAIESITIGADHFLHKGIDPAQLAAVVTSRVRRVRAVNRRIEYLARRDPATGVYNRAYFAQELEKSLLNTTPTTNALVCCLIDNFLALRDALSEREIGAFFAAVAGAIKGCTQAGDLIGRHNEFAFLCLISRTNPAEIAAFAERLRAAIAALAPSLGERQVRTTVSLGVRVAHAQPVHALIDGAMQAATQAREAGGNQVRIEDEGESVDQERAGREARYVAILGGQDPAAGRMQLAYQPMVSLGQETRSHLEVLLRVLDGQGGQYPVAEVVETAARYGLTQKLDLRVIGLALFALLKGRLRHTQDILFLKVSKESVRSDALFKAITAKIQASGIGGRLAFMFPQAAIWAEFDLFSHRVAQLKAAGALVGVDQFGGDISDVQLLDRVLLDFVKLHRGLTDGLEADAERRHRFESILEHAHARGVRVIVGFIEHPATLAFLWRTGVDLFQGNALQPPGEEMVYESITLVETGLYSGARG